MTTLANATDAPTILVYGDSLSAGYGIDVDQSWPALLQTRLQDEGYEHRVVNASISGETTDGGVARIESALQQFSPSLLVLELGANDGLRGFPTSRMKKNLGVIIQTAKKYDANVVLLGIRIPLNYGPRYSAAFEQAFEDVATSEAIPWLEFFMKGIAFDDKLLQDDRIHPNAEAQSILLDNAWPLINATIKQ